MSLRRPLEDESLVDESLVKKRKALSTVVVVPDDSQSLVVLESHVEAQAPAAQAEEISKEEYERVKETILEGKAKEAAGLVPELRPAAEPAAQAGGLGDLLGEGTAVAAAEAARPRAEAARPHEEAPEADLGS